MNLPSREECEGWDHTQVALFMCKNKMQECAAMVTRLKMNGQRLLNLSDCDMSKFTLIQQPQLQKIVQDIRKNDGSLLNKLRRLKTKPAPNLPARDYRGGNRESDDQESDPDYDNDDMSDPHEDDSYEPPPSHRVFTPTPSVPFPRGEYVDSCHNRPSRLPRKPLRPAKPSKQLPPEPSHAPSDEEDYIDPDANTEDDNYVEPAENPPAKPGLKGGNRTVRGHPMLPPQRSPSPVSDFYEVPDTAENSTKSLPATRLCPIPAPQPQSHSLPPKPSPRVNVRRSPPPPVQEPTDEDEYEVCDADGPSEGRPPLRLPKPLPRDKSPKPPLVSKPDLKPRESRTLPVVQTEQKPPLKAFTLDLKRPKIPLPQFTKPSERGGVAAENGSLDSNKDADVIKKPWYASACDRKTADDCLMHTNKDGAFMVRKSSGQDAQQPYTLVVFYKGRVYNIPIRCIPNIQQYALGREKRGEEHFSSVSHIIENHQRNPLVLIDSQNNSKDATKLCYPVKP
ncbi:B-cell linker protein isoform X2 [Parambassis ranga]|uniref:B-cell linker protein isoform X2 n=1 Tax=Parambassis ranga TaxID=210632 RepID=A0A6P7JPT2_9TELE|nr:B-cell linker protein isoform X2 [Parambassis ranga]